MKTASTNGRRHVLPVLLAFLCFSPYASTAQLTDASTNSSLSFDATPEARERRDSTLVGEYNFPWMANLRSLGALRCSGVLIDTAWVLTAASCFDGNYNKDNYNVDLLSTNNDDNNNNNANTTSATTSSLNNYRDLSVHIESYYLHGRYRRGQTRHNLALISLNQNVTSPYLPADVIGAGDDVRNGECLSTGWDFNGNSRTTPSVRRWRTVSSAECSLTYNITVPSDQLCALRPEDGQGDCTGHRNSPLVCKVNGTWKVTGLVSRNVTDLCTSGTQGQQPALFLSVQHYLPFMEKRGRFKGIPAINK